MEKIDKSDVLELAKKLSDGSRLGALEKFTEAINALPTTTDEWISDKLFSAFIKSLIDSGVYTVSELASKDKDTLADAYYYWVDSLRVDYPIQQPELPQPPTK